MRGERRNARLAHQRGHGGGGPETKADEDLKIQAAREGEKNSEDAGEQESTGQGPADEPLRPSKDVTTLTTRGPARGGIKGTTRPPIGRPSRLGCRFGAAERDKARVVERSWADLTEEEKADFWPPYRLRNPFPRQERDRYIRPQLIASGSPALTEWGEEFQLAMAYVRSAGSFLSDLSAHLRDTPPEHWHPEMISEHVAATTQILVDLEAAALRGQRSRHTRAGAS